MRTRTHHAIRMIGAAADNKLGRHVSGFPQAHAFVVVRHGALPTTSVQPWGKHGITNRVLCSRILGSDDPEGGPELPDTPSA